MASDQNVPDIFGKFVSTPSLSDAIKTKGIGEIELALSESLTNLLGHKVKVNIGAIDFTTGSFSHAAELSKVTISNSYD